MKQNKINLAERNKLRKPRKIQVGLREILFEVNFMLRLFEVTPLIVASVKNLIDESQTWCPQHWITCVPYQAEGNPTKAVIALKDQVKAIFSGPFIQHFGPISSYPPSFRSEQISNPLGKCTSCRYKLLSHIYFMTLLIWFNHHSNLGHT